MRTVTDNTLQPGECCLIHNGQRVILLTEATERVRSVRSPFTILAGTADELWAEIDRLALVVPPFIKRPE